MLRTDLLGPCTQYVFLICCYRSQELPTRRSVCMANSCCVTGVHTIGDYLFHGAIRSPAAWLTVRSQHPSSAEIVNAQSQRRSKRGSSPPRAAIHGHPGVSVEAAGLITCCHCPTAQDLKGS